MLCQTTTRHMSIGSAVGSQRPNRAPRLTHQHQQQRISAAAARWRARAEVQQQEAAAAGAAAAAAGEQSDSEERVPPGCARYTVKIPKPLGMVLEEGPGGRGVFVMSGGSGSGCGSTAGLRLAPRRLQLSSAPLSPPTHPPATLQAEVFPEGNAALLAPEISVKDELIATSGLTYTTQQVAPAACPLPAPTRFLFPALQCAQPHCLPPKP